METSPVEGIPSGSAHGQADRSEATERIPAPQAKAQEAKESPRLSSKVAMDRMTEELRGSQAVANAIKRDEEE